MKTITITTENSETYSSISNFFIDYYMTDANGEFVKVYLYLVRLLSRANDITVAQIADHFNLTENDICRSIKYWISKDVLKLNYDGQGSPSGIVLLPLHLPKEANIQLGTDPLVIVSSKRSNKSETKIAPVIETPVYEEISIPPKPSFSADALTSVENDEDWSDILYQVETLFSKQISSRDTEALLYIYETLGFNLELMEYLIEYCATLNKKNCKYMEAVAISWYKEGIKSRHDARQHTNASSALTKNIFKQLHIRRSYPTTIEQAYITTWTKDFGFSEQLILHACDKAMLSRPDSANFPYVNGILDNWNKNNIKTLKDVEALDKEFIKTVKQPQYTQKVSNFNNFKQTRMDNEIDEMEVLLRKEVNNS